jgi:hypothetical protein
LQHGLAGLEFWPTVLLWAVVVIVVCMPVPVMMVMMPVIMVRMVVFCPDFGYFKFSVWLAAAAYSAHEKVV